MKPDAKQYDAWYSTPFGRYADKLEKELIFEFLGKVGGKRVLDAGCGTGNYTVELAKRKAVVVGLDSSVEMLKFAKEKAKGIQFVLGSMLCLPFKDKSFDALVSVTALEFCLQNPGRAVQEMRRVGSRAVVGVLNKWSLYCAEKKLESKFKESVYSKARFYSIIELKRLFGGVEWSSTLFALPFMPSWLLKIFAKFEKRLSKIFKPFGAFIVLRGTTETLSK